MLFFSVEKKVSKNPVQQELFCENIQNLIFSFKSCEKLLSGNLIHKML